MKKIYIFLFCITYFIVIFSCLYVGFQNDTFYSIKIGQDILNFGIDMKDHYSWLSGLDYTYPHWLFDLVVGCIYNLFNFKGLYFFTFIMYFIVGITLFYCFNKLKYNKLLSYVVMIITIIILRPYATCRAQIVTYSLIIGFYYNLVLLIRDSDKRRIIYLFLISLLIVNIHAAVWPFIFILFLPYFVEYILYRFKSKFIFVNSIRFNNINIKILLFAFFICLFAGLITPIGFTPFTYLFNTFRGSTQFYIGEHQPITLWYRKLLLLFLFVLFVVLKNKKMYLSDILLIIGLFIMMLSSQRHSAIFIILSVFIFLKYFDIKVFKYFKINKIEKYKLFKNVVGIVSLIFLVWYPCISINISKINSPLIKDLYPVKAVKFIKDNLNYKDYNIFNDYDIGSYLLFNDIKVMFDSRADLYTKEFNGKYDYFIEFMELGANYEEIFDKYNISYALVYRDSKLYLRLNMNSRYTSIYQDNKVEIFVDNEVLDDILKI